MTTPKLALLAATLIAASACTIRTGEDARGPTSYDQRNRSDGGNVSPPRATPKKGAVARNGSWQKLGEGTADGRSDHDVITVGRKDGTFRAIRFQVRNSSVEMKDVVVHFTDGTRFSPTTRLVFQEGSTSNTVDLPGGRRAIESVNFRYSDSSGTGRAVVEVWGI